MKKRKVAAAYANVLFQFTVTHKIMVEIGRQFEWFMQVWDNNKLLRDFFLCHSLTRGDKEKKLERIFSQHLHPVFLIFFRLLIRRHHCGIISFIFQNFEQLQDSYYNRHHVNLISPFPLEEKYFQQFHALLSQFISQNIILTPIVDPEILGGFIISSDTFRIDCSIKREMEIFRKRFFLISNGGVRN